MEAYLLVTLPNGSTTHEQIEEAQVTVGRSPTAGIPLINAEELLPEHMMLAPRSEGCWVAVAEGATPPATVGGRTVVAEVVPWGTEILVGGVRLKVSDKPLTQKQGAVSKPIMVSAVLGIPMLAYLIMSSPGGGLPNRPSAPAPDLFDPPPPCSGTGEVARRLGRDAAEAANLRTDRYPYDAQEGVRAVHLYDEAQACYQAGGMPEDAARVGREREALARLLNEDYRMHRLRLGRALDLDHGGEALMQTRALSELLSHKPQDPYASWVRLLNRHLQLSADQAAASD